MPLRNRKTSANTHDKRHENGLAQPTRKVARPKSDLTAAQNGNGLVVSPSATKIVGDADDDSDDQSSTDGAADGTPTQGTMAASRQASLDGGSEGQSDASGNTPPEEHEPIASTPQDPIHGQAQRHGSFSSGTSADTATTIIWPHSLWDVVAVLLFLLQLPPTFLSAVQICFALITFGNPLSGWSLNSLTSVHDWFHGHGGNPSIVTTIIADLMFFLAWFALSGVLPISKDIILDVAQGVIAMYLGGGTSVRGGWSHTLACISVVTVPHILRTSGWQRYGASPVESFLTKSNLGPLKQAPIFFSSHYTSHSWARTTLEIHIITQGIVRVIRRWFDRQPGTSSTKKLDPEAASTPTSTATTVPIDPSSEGARNTSTDGRPPGLPPAVREKEKPVSSGKKRRKHGNFVRSQQPFWAAIASTKITVTKEMEHTQAAADALAATAADAVRAGESNQSRGEDQVWIERIDQNEVWFNAMMDTMTGEHLDTAQGTDPKHFTVRVNGAHWSQFEVRELEQRGEGAGIKGVFTGRIFGLTPSENFLLEFIGGAECQVFYSAHLVTRPLANSETGPTVVAPQPQEALRPASPVTTLKKTIAAAENQSNEVRNRSRKLRKDHRNANNALKKEVEGLEGRLSNYSNGDDRQRQRQTQYLHNIKQTEDSVAQITDQLDSLGDMPETEREMNELTRHDWQQAKAQRSVAREDFENSKAEVERDINMKRAATASDRQKMERLEGRLAKLEQSRENLVSLIALARKEKIRKENVRNQMLSMHLAKERDILSSITYCESQRQDWETRQFHTQEQIYFLENNMNASMNGQPANPHTPELSFAGLGNNHRTAAFGSLQQQYAIGTGSGHHSRANSNRPAVRGRSSSMLSEISGFTDDETGPVQQQSSGVEFIGPAAAVGHGMTRNNSAGSTTVAGSVVGSQRDPKTPATKFSPIGTEVRKGSPGLYRLYS